MSIVVNGELYVVPSPTTIEGLLRLLRPERPFAAALNGEFVPAVEYEGRVLTEGDHVDVVQPSTGG